MSAIALSLSAAIEAMGPAVDDREAASRTATLERLRGPGDPFDEGVDVRHVTASSFVVSRRGVILHLHRRLGIWVQPGGHVDAGEDPATAALRETREETGLPAAHLTPPLLFHVDEHPGPRGHTHFDVRYVLVSPPVDPAPPDDESQDVYWFTFEEAVARCEPGLAPALRALGAWARDRELPN